MIFVTHLTYDLTISQKLNAVKPASCHS